VLTLVGVEESVNRLLHNLVDEPVKLRSPKWSGESMARTDATDHQPPCTARAKSGSISESDGESPRAGGYGQETNALQPVVRIEQAHADSRACPKREGMPAASGVRTDWQPHAINPAVLCGPKVTKNVEQERWNPLRPSPGCREQVVNRMDAGGRIGREANAPGKARGYADAGTAARKVERQVGATL
jgi:hypothetical protein